MSPIVVKRATELKITMTSNGVSAMLILVIRLMNAIEICQYYFMITWGQFAGQGNSGDRSMSPFEEEPFFIFRFLEYVIIFILIKNVSN